MPEPPGGRGQKSIFAFPGFKKYVEVRGVLHEVVPPALDDFDAKHPLLCRWGCGERFSRGSAKASHERHCKKQCRAPEAPRAQAEDAEMEETVPAVPALLAVPAVPAAPPAVPNNEPLPDSMECHRARLRPRVPAEGPAAKVPAEGPAASSRRCQPEAEGEEEEEEEESSDTDKSADEDSDEDSDEESYGLPDEDSDEEG